MMRLLKPLLILALVLAACGEATDAGDQSPAGTWELSSGSLRGEPIPIVEGWPITLSFDGDTVGGTAACNGYGGRADIDGTTIAFSQIGITEMACGDFDQGGVMESESIYMEAFVIIDTSARDGDTLTLSGPEAELVFHLLPPVPTSELTGTVWVLDSLISGEATSNTRGPKATLELFSDG